MSLNIKVKIESLPQVTVLSGEEIMYIEQDGQPKKITTELLRSSVTITKQVLAYLATANELIPNQRYVVTDATGEEITIIVTAKSISGLFPNIQLVGDNFDIMEYDIDTDVVTCYDFLAGTVRKTDDEWAFIDDANHTPKGLASVDQVGNEVRVTYARNDYTKVVLFQATPDDVYADLGFSIGTDVGLTFTNIHISNNKLASAFIFWNGSAFATVSPQNIVSVAWNVPNNALEINHKPIANLTYSVSAYGVDLIPVIVSVGDEQTLISFYYVGTLQTSPNTDMKILFNKSNQQPVLAADQEIAGNNIWLNGIMSKIIS